MFNRRRTAELHGGLQHGRHAGAVVVDARACRDAVQVSSHHDHVLGRARPGLCDHIAGSDRLGVRVEFDGGRSGFRPQSGAISLADTDNRDRRVIVLTDSAAHLLLVDVVGNDHRHGSESGCYSEFVGKRATSTINQHYRTFDGQTVVVRGCATGRLVGGCGDQRAADTRASGAVFQCMRFDRGTAHRQFRLLGVEDAGLELWGLHVESLVAQHPRNEVDAGVITGGADCSRAVMVVGDALQCGEVGHHGIGGHAVSQRIAEFACRRAGRHRLRDISRAAAAQCECQNNCHHGRCRPYPRHITQVRRMPLPFSRCAC